LSKIIISVTNDLVTDNRVHKVAQTLYNNGFEVLVIGRKFKKSLPLNRQYKTKRVKLLFNKSFMFYAEYNFRLFFILLFSKYDIILSNDLDTLLANYLASKIRNKKIVYDSHEYYTELPELVNRPFVKKTWTFIEKNILPNLKNTYTVCESISEIYNKLYNTDFKVVRNLPLYNFNTNENTTKNKNNKIIIYQGALNLGRGLEKVISAMKYLNGVTLLIVGDGDITNYLKKHCINENVSEKVIFKGKVPFDDLINYTCTADLGISLEENLGLNYYFALPNKIFDYIKAGVPVVGSDFPEIRKIILNYKVGILISDTSAQNLAKTIENLLNDKEKLNTLKANCYKAAKELCWENEEKILIEIFNNIS